MKKSFITLAAAIITVCALMATASAASYEAAADKLNSLGLFQGTDAGYDLDRAPTRAEAVVMLVRLLGLEEDALDGDYEHPFTDVPEWAKPYIAFAYEAGLAAGTSETTFTSDGLCTAQMYTTFVLRALGYRDAEGDFSYAEAISFGKKTGIVDDVLAGGKFLRDEMVAISYLALAAAPTDTKYPTLLVKLVEDGAVKADAANAVLEKLALIEEYAQAAEAFNETAVAMKVNMLVKEESASGKALMDMNMDMAMIVNGPGMDDSAGDDITASIVMSKSADGKKTEIYMTENVLYVELDGVKVQVPPAFAENTLGFDVSGILEVFDAGGVAALAAGQPYMINDITKATEGGLAVYTLKMSGGLENAVVNKVIWIMSSLSRSSVLDGLDIGDIAVKVSFNADGAIKKMEMSVEGKGEKVSANLTMDAGITAVGDAVKITLPEDLYDYMPFDVYLEEMFSDTYDEIA